MLPFDEALAVTSTANRGGDLGAYLDRQEHTLPRVCSYDVLVYILRKVGSLGLRQA